MTALEQIRRLYFATTRATVQKDLERAERPAEAAG